jgi:hypothetical protein
VLTVIALTLVVGGGLFLRTGLRLRAECYEADAARVLDFAVDVGSVGEHRTTLKQIAAFPCKQYIRIEPELRDGEDGDRVLQGLELTVQVVDASGFEWLAGVYPTPWAMDDESLTTTIVMERPMPRGDYAVVVDVVRPVPAMAGRPVRLVSGYVLCGIEWMGPTVAVGGGSVGMAIGSLIGLVLWSTRRRAAKPEFPGVSSTESIESTGGKTA